MTLIKDVTDCSTYTVRGLDRQLIYQMNKISPGLLVRIDDLNVSLGQSVHPWLQAPAKERLAYALQLRNKQMTINSAYRTLAGQMLLWLHSQNKRCGITIAAEPGKSNHNNASAIDIEDYTGWRSILDGCNWKWLGDFDKVHFDCKDPRIQPMHRVAVTAFQQLWNLAHPDDLVPAQGDFGPITSAKLSESPAEGFADLTVPRILKLTQPIQRGADVEALQRALQAAKIPVTIDRVFGPGSANAVKQFQTKKNLGADGIVGAGTRKALNLSNIGFT